MIKPSLYFTAPGGTAGGPYEMKRMVGLKFELPVYKDGTEIAYPLQSMADFLSKAAHDFIATFDPEHGECPEDWKPLLTIP